jgi:GxxExxY protein
MPRIVEKDLSYEITGLLFKVHKELGQFASERQYADKFEEYLKKHNVDYRREFEIKNLQPDSPKGNRADFVIKDKVIVDLKAKQFITKEDYYQMQRYLKAANLELGMVVNFRAYRLFPKRVLNSSHSGHLDDNSDY